MRKGGSSKKGGAFERHVCKRLSLWLTDGERDDLLWRTAMSGGRATLQRRKGVKNISQVGDVAAIDPAGNRLTDVFVVECKHVQDLNFLSAVSKRKGKLWTFWRKLLHEATVNDRFPMLIARQNGFPILMMLNGSGAARLLPHSEVQQRGTLGPPAGPVFIYLFDEVLARKCLL